MSVINFGSSDDMKNSLAVRLLNFIFVGNSFHDVGTDLLNNTSNTQFGNVTFSNNFL